MFGSILSLVSLGVLLPSVYGHGQVYDFISSYGTWTAADAYLAANASSPMRKLNTYGPVADFTGKDITCGEGGNTPVNAFAQVNAGETVTFVWNQWSTSHSGPVMTYMASCTGGCATFKGDTGKVWAKIDQDGWFPNRTAAPWGENIISLPAAKYSVTIPAGLKPGEYIIRHEILALHVASIPMGAQFYPNCVQVKVVKGGSTTLPSGVALPGAYDPNDPNILTQLWWYTAQNTSAHYTVPGGPVVLPGGTGDWGNTQKY